MIITSLTQHLLNRHAGRALEILDRYWSGLALRGDVPLWSEIDPGAMQDALDHAFLAEQFGRCHARIRVAGCAVTDMAGQASGGLALSLLIRPEDRGRFSAAVLAVCDGRRPVACDLTRGQGMPHLAPAARMVLYPLRDTTGRVTQFLGGLASVGDAGPEPAPYGLAQVIARPGLASRRSLRLVIDNT